MISTCYFKTVMHTVALPLSFVAYYTLPVFQNTVQEFTANFYINMLGMFVTVYSAEKFCKLTGLETEKRDRYF